MNRKEPNRLLFYAAAVLLILTWLTLFLENEAALGWMQGIGWAVGALSLVLIGLPMIILRRRGQPEEGQDWTHTSTLVDTGIYALVRHPLYLGWALLYVALALLSQHWLTLVLALPGVVCLVLISRMEERDLVAKFGEVYEHYQDTVPAMNLPLGILRLLRRKTSSEENF
ncbi:MAG: isoprenylcysteine carboxylmethyltransferase family protein [Anaerolineae bacterium]